MIRFFKMNSMDSSFIFFDENNADYNLLKTSERIKLICDYKKGLGADGIVFAMQPKDKDNHSCRMVFYNTSGDEEEACATALCCVAHLYLSQRGGKNYVVIESKEGLYRVNQIGNDNSAFAYEAEFDENSLNCPKQSEVLSLRKQDGKLYATCDVQEVGYGYLSGLFITKLSEFDNLYN